MVRTVEVATIKSAQVTQLESERSVLAQILNSGSTGVYLSSDDIMKMEGIFLDAHAKIAFFRAKNYKMEGTTGMTRTMRTQVLFLSDMCESPNVISKSVVPAPWRDRM